MSGSPYEHTGHRDICHEDQAIADAVEAWYRRRETMAGRLKPCGSTFRDTPEPHEARLDLSSSEREPRKRDDRA